MDATAGAAEMLVLLSHAVYVFQFLHLFFFLMFFFKPLSRVVEKLLYTYRQIVRASQVALVGT